MDTILHELIINGGPLGLMVVMTWMFLRDRKEIAAEHRAWINDLMKEHLYAREQSRLCVEGNTHAMKENTKAVEALAIEIRRK